MQHPRRCVTARPHPAQGGDRPAERAAARLERAETDRVARKVYWGLLPLLTVMGVFIYLDRSNLSFISSQIIPALGLTNTDYGLGSGAPCCHTLPCHDHPFLLGWVGFSGLWCAVLPCCRRAKALWFFYPKASMQTVAALENLPQQLVRRPLWGCLIKL